MKHPQKISIRFFDDREVRALWDENNAKWWFSVLDIIAVPTNQNDYNKTRNYWKYLKSKLKKEGSQVVSDTTQLKLLAPDGKKRLSDMLDYEGIIALGKTFPGTNECSPSFYGRKRQKRTHLAGFDFEKTSEKMCGLE